ncbi:MAG: orotate phosphoribosyltransferase [Candidatus Glassbacteria bacterium]|nr:orotate phosphoribosyltransferase [Candidatus Glassbacteria bacterium]
MKREEVLELFSKYKAYLEGHFLLTSGLHSPHYFQCARVLQYPEAAERLGRALGEKISAALGGEVPAAVISPAMGGLIIGHELGRALGCRAIFVERMDGSMRLRRFDLEPGEKVVVVEDVVTTGGSFLETVKVAEEAGCKVLAACCLIDRSGGGSKFSPALTSLVEVEVVNYRPEDCPLCGQGVPLVKPGSRNTVKKGF